MCIYVYYPKLCILSYLSAYIYTYCTLYIQRGARFFIDFFVMIVRIILWLQYNAIDSIFLIKNIYNLIHTITMVERYYGGRHYPTEALFAKEVRPNEWYVLTAVEY